MRCPISCLCAKHDQFEPGGVDYNQLYTMISCSMRLLKVIMTTAQLHHQTTSNTLMLEVFGFSVQCEIFFV